MHVVEVVKPLDKRTVAGAGISAGAGGGADTLVGVDPKTQQGGADQTASKESFPEVFRHFLDFAVKLMMFRD